MFKLKDIDWRKIFYSFQLPRLAGIPHNLPLGFSKRRLQQATNGKPRNFKCRHHRFQRICICVKADGAILVAEAASPRAPQHRVRVYVRNEYLPIRPNYTAQFSSESVQILDIAQHETGKYYIRRAAADRQGCAMPQQQLGCSSKLLGSTFQHPRLRIDPGQTLNTLSRQPS